VVWELVQTVELVFVDVEFKIRIEKKAPSSGVPQPWDTYWVRLFLDGEEDNENVEMRQRSESDYTEYRVEEFDDHWHFGLPVAPDQHISTTDMYPIAWDRDEPGPPWVRLP